jgi:hypothetical protein
MKYNYVLIRSTLGLFISASQLLRWLVRQGRDQVELVTQMVAIGDRLEKLEGRNFGRETPLSVLRS